MRHGQDVRGATCDVLAPPQPSAKAGHSYVRGEAGKVSGVRRF